MFTAVFLSLATYFAARAVLEMDTLATAYPLLLTLLMLLGLLELAIPLNKDDWSYRHVWQMQGIIYLLGLFVAYRRYGVTER